MGISLRRSRDLGTTQISTPTGVVMPFAGANSPDGWLLCFGQAVSRTDYSGLFSVIGTSYGTGDGSTTFNLPDMRGRVAAGKDNMGGSAANRLTAGGSGITGTTLGNAGGVETHTLTSAQMPSHTHTQDSHNHTQNAHTHTQDAHQHEWVARGTLGGNRKMYGDYNGGSGSTHFNPNSIGTITGPSFANPAVAENTVATNQNTTATNIATTATNQNTGGGGAHQNTQPTIILNYIIKV
jgi:microcystin-dependent protein